MNNQRYWFKSRERERERCLKGRERERERERERCLKGREREVFRSVTTE